LVGQMRGNHRFTPYYHHVINNLRNKSDSPPLHRYVA